MCQTLTDVQGLTVSDAFTSHLQISFLDFKRFFTDFIHLLTVELFLLLKAFILLFLQAFFKIPILT